MFLCFFFNCCLIKLPHQPQILLCLIFFLFFYESLAVQYWSRSCFSTKHSELVSSNWEAPSPSQGCVCLRRQGSRRKHCPAGKCCRGRRPAALRTNFPLTIFGSYCCNYVGSPGHVMVMCADHPLGTFLITSNGQIYLFGIKPALQLCPEQCLCE